MFNNIFLHNINEKNVIFVTKESSICFSETKLDKIMTRQRDIEYYINQYTQQIQVCK